MLPPVRIEPGPVTNLWFQVQHSPFWANWKFVLLSELTGNLLVRLRLQAPYIVMLYWFQLNQVVHEQKFKDPLAHARLAQKGEE